jgi:AraC-like DNA-binding protein
MSSMKSNCLIQVAGINYYLEIECLKRESYTSYNPKVHVHPSYHLILISKGWNRTTIGDSPVFDLKPNTLLFINPLVPHRFFVDPKPGVEHTSMIWRFRDEKGNYAVFPLQQLNGAHPEAASPYLLRKLCDFDAALFLHKHHQAIKAIQGSENFFSVSMLLFELWFFGFNLLMDGEKMESPYSRPLLGARIKSIIEWQMIDCKLNVKRIAAQMKMHPNYINSAFKGMEGTTINHYLRDKRIELAKTILANSSYHIGEVASMCGFTEHSYFTRSFRKVCGMSPGEYRASVGE